MAAGTGWRGLGLAIKKRVLSVHCSITTCVIVKSNPVIEMTSFRTENPKSTTTADGFKDQKQNPTRYWGKLFCNPIYGYTGQFPHCGSHLPIMGFSHLASSNFTHENMKRQTSTNHQTRINSISSILLMSIHKST